MQVTEVILQQYDFYLHNSLSKELGISKEPSVWLLRHQVLLMANIDVSKYCHLYRFNWRSLLNQLFGGSLAFVCLPISTPCRAQYIFFLFSQIELAIVLSLSFLFLFLPLVKGYYVSIHVKLLVILKFITSAYVLELLNKDFCSNDLNIIETTCQLINKNF